jgi:predicted DNA-binding transcriptional regulator AlpA
VHAPAQPEEDVHVQKTIDETIKSMMRAEVERAVAEALAAQQQPPADDGVLDTHEAAEFVKLSRVQLSRMREEKRGPKFYKLGAKVVYRRADLIAWLRSMPSSGGEVSVMSMEKTAGRESPAASENAVQKDARSIARQQPPDNQLDAAAVLAFLHLWALDGPWHLSAFYWDKRKGRTKPPQGRTFRPGEELELSSWVAKWNRAGYNIHFSVAQLQDDLGPKRAKADKEELRACVACHVDADPVSAETAEEDCERFERLATEGNPHVGLPPATLVLRSGRGVQSFYMLHEPATIEEVEARNKWLGVQFGADGDGTWNADRVMKVPGTIAWANSTKRAKGWPAVSGVARLLPHRWARVALSDIPAPPEQPEPTTTAAKPATRKGRSKSKLQREPLPDLGTIISEAGDWTDEIVGDDLRHALLWGWYPAHHEGATCTFDGREWCVTRCYPGDRNRGLQRPADRSAVLWWICCELRREGSRLQGARVGHHTGPLGRAARRRRLLVAGLPASLCPAGRGRVGHRDPEAGAGQRVRATVHGRQRQGSPEPAEHPPGAPPPGRPAVLRPVPEQGADRAPGGLRAGAGRRRGEPAVPAHRRRAGLPRADRLLQPGAE